MKKRTTKKLELLREDLRVLKPAELERPAGASDACLPSSGGGCQTATGPNRNRL